MFAVSRHMLFVISFAYGACRVGHALVHGVALAEQEKYSGESFLCFDGSATVSSSRINDDSCDCTDGSDEPGTGACAGQDKTLFWCNNDGSIPKQLFASRVGDGVCDCCDGSDESSLARRRPGSACPNTCAEQGRLEREEAAVRAEQLRQALKKKSEAIDAALREREGIDKEIEKLTADKPALEAAVEEAKAKVDAEKAKAEAEKPQDAPATATADADAAPEQANVEVKSATPDSAAASDVEGEKSSDATAAEKPQVSEYAKWMDGAESTMKEEEPKKPEVSEYTKWMDGAESAMADDTSKSDLRLLRPTTVPGLSTWLTAGPKQLMRKSGKFYCEVKLGDDFQDSQVGFLTDEFGEGPDANTQGVGDDQHGWAADGLRHKKWHGSEQDAKWPSDWKPQDVIGCAIDFEGKQMKFSLNGEWVDAATMEFSLGEERSIFPAVSMMGAFEFNIPRSTWEFSPPDATYDEWAASGKYHRPYVEEGAPDKEEDEPIEEDTAESNEAAPADAPNEEDSEAVKEHKAAKESLKKTEDELSKLQTKRARFEDDKLGYAALDGETLSKTAGEFKYKVTFFKDAKQDYTSLGNWAGWKGAKTASFTNGQSCWQGPARSLTVNFECGLEEALGDIAEPSRCVYEATVFHPAACEPEDLERIEAPRAIHPRDEL